jgi:hypothetical protein
MITRQSQMGEFIGEDAGSPITAKLAWNSDTPVEFQAADGGIKPYDPELPLETIMEALPVPLELAGRLHNLDLRLALGRRWKRLLEKSGHGDKALDFQNAYGFVAPDPAAKADFPVTAHAAAWQTIAAVAGRAIDGGKLLIWLTAGKLASEGRGYADPEKTEIDDLGRDFLKWAQGLFYQPGDAMQCWVPRHLEDSGRLSGPDGAQAAALAAPEYRGARLDWFSFDAVHTAVFTIFNSVALKPLPVPDRLRWSA